MGPIEGALEERRAVGDGTFVIVHVAKENRCEREGVADNRVHKAQTVLTAASQYFATQMLCGSAALRSCHASALRLDTPRQLLLSQENLLHHVAPACNAR